MIIGMVGFIGSGKGSVGSILATEHGYTRDSFARPLKDAVAAIFGWDRKMVEGDTDESRAWREQPDAFWSEKFGKTLTPRLALQLMGTEAGRDVFHKDIWVISLLQRSQGKNIVITDVRFRNEVAALKQNGGLIVRVRRGTNPLWYQAASDANKGDLAAIQHMQNIGIHPSEWDWIGSEVDYTIYNDGSLADLRHNVRAVAEVAQNLLTCAPK